MAAATREALSEGGEKFDGLRALAMGAIQSAQGRATRSARASRRRTRPCGRSSATS